MSAKSEASRWGQLRTSGMRVLSELRSCTCPAARTRLHKKLRQVCCPWYLAEAQTTLPPWADMHQS